MSPAISFREIIGVPPATASTADSTLVIIDAQNEYAEGKLQVTNAPASRKAIAFLLQRYRDAKGRVVHVIHEAPDGAPVFTPKTRLAEEFEELAPILSEKVIRKHHPSSFAGTDLQEYLDSHGSKKIVLAGYMAHVCISTTARQAAQRGYDVIVVEDAVGDRDIPGVDAEELTKVALNEIRDAFGTILQSKDIG